MKRRTLIQAAVLVPAAALVHVPRSNASRMVIDGHVLMFHDIDGSELARVEQDGKVVRRPGCASRCGRMFWEAAALVESTRSFGRNFPLVVRVEKTTDLGDWWRVSLPANGSIKDIRFDNVDPSAKFFWSMIQAGRPPDMTWS